MTPWPAPTRTPCHRRRLASLVWQLVKMGWQFSGSQVLDEIHVPFFGAFGAACDGAIVARWSANSLGML